MENLTFKRIGSGTHGDAAVVYNNTDVPMFFWDGNTLERVESEEGIDAYEGRTGDFYVLESDYETASEVL